MQKSRRYVAGSSGQTDGLGCVEVLIDSRPSLLEALDRVIFQKL
jgi:hypothetical protein